MPLSQRKQTEGERVKAWKKKNPDMVYNQRRRRRTRILAERRASDPTGELNYGDIDGVDKPYPDYPDSSEMAPAPREPEGIPDPPEFVAELEREHKRRILENCRRQLEMKNPPQRS
jgi:hypothetical protein